MDRCEYQQSIPHICRIRVQHRRKTSNATYDETTPFDAKGVNSPPWSLGTPRPNTLPFCAPDKHDHGGVSCDGSLNTIICDGFVTKGGDTFRLGEGIDGGQLYVIAHKRIGEFGQFDRVANVELSD